MLEVYSRERYENALMRGCPAIRSERNVLCFSGVAVPDTDVWHTVVDWSEVLRLGAPGLLHRAEEAKRAKQADGTLTDRQAVFYDAVIIAFAAMLTYMRRLLAEAEGKWYPAVIEGATPIVGDNGELHVLYACSGYWTTGYKLGQMTYLGGDLLAKESWKKSPQAVFSKNDEVCGVGGPSIFTSPNGKTRCILYHGYLGKDTSSGRYCFMEPYTVDADGVHIGKDGHPSPLTTTFTVPLNTMPLGAKVSGFDNLGMTRVKLKIGSHTGSVNETEAQLDAVPVIRNNRTMLPARFVAESFGAAVTWDGTTSTAKFVAKDGTVISIRIGAAGATVGGKAVALDTPAYIDAASGRTYLPVRFLAESLGALVVWNGEISTAYLIR